MGRRLRTIDPAIEQEIERMGLVLRARVEYDDFMAKDKASLEHYVKKSLARQLGAQVEEYADFDKLMPGVDYADFGKYGRKRMEAEVVIMSKAELALLMSRQFVRYL